MYERKKEEKRDEQLSGERFEDWDNPEDQDEDAPEDYYERPLGEEDDEGYIPDESDPDYELSEAHGYSDWEPGRASIIPPWVIVAASLLLIFAILIPVLIQIS